MTTLRKVGFSLTLVIFLGIFTELVTRVALMEYRPEPVIPKHLGTFDRVFGWNNQPNTQGVSRRIGYDIEYRINSKGLRDSETSYEKPEGVFRILLIGDSLTFGYGVPIEKHYSTLLEGYFTDVEVINLGVSGFGVDQELLFLRNEGLRYQPDLVLAYIPHFKAHRHMHSERWGKPKPYYVLEDENLVLKNSPIESGPPKISLLNRLHLGIHEYSKAYRTACYGFEMLQYRLGIHPVTQDELTDQNASDAAFVEELFKLGQRIVVSMDEASRAAGARFVLITPINELLEEARQQEIPTLDTTASLGNVQFELPDRLSHINESGNGVLAWEIVRFLTDQGMIPEEHENKAPQRTRLY